MPERKLHKNEINSSCLIQQHAHIILFPKLTISIKGGIFVYDSFPLDTFMKLAIGAAFNNTVITVLKIDKQDLIGRRNGIPLKDILFILNIFNKFF